MKREDYEEVVRVIDLQEQLVRVEHFTHADMLELGLLVVNEAAAQGASVAVSVSKPSGAVVFQHLMEGTNGANQSWIRRKFNVTAEYEHATLRAWAKEVLTGETMADYGMNPAEHVYSGGAFPIRMKGGELVGVLSVSGFPHFKDHQFGVNCLCKWLGLSDVPEVPFFDVWRE